MAVQKLPEEGRHNTDRGFQSCAYNGQKRLSKYRGLVSVRAMRLFAIITSLKPS